MTLGISAIDDTEIRNNVCEKTGTPTKKFLKNKANKQLACKETNTLTKNINLWRQVTGIPYGLS